MRIFILLPLIVFSMGAAAFEIGSWRLDGRAALLAVDQAGHKHDHRKQDREDCITAVFHRGLLP